MCYYVMHSYSFLTDSAQQWSKPYQPLAHL